MNGYLNLAPVRGLNFVLGPVLIIFRKIYMYLNVVVWKILFDIPLLLELAGDTKDMATEVIMHFWNSERFKVLVTIFIFLWYLPFYATDIFFQTSKENWLILVPLILGSICSSVILGLVGMFKCFFNIFIINPEFWWYVDKDVFLFEKLASTR